MKQTMQRAKDNRKANSQVKNCHQLVSDEIKRDMLSASMQPKRLCDVENFKTLHSPRVHGMTEWLLQYENACRQQEMYMQQLKELRQQFESKRHKKINICRTDKLTTDIQSFFWRSGIPLSGVNKRYPNRDNVRSPRKSHNTTRKSRMEEPGFPKTNIEFLVTPECVHAAKYSLRSAKPLVNHQHLDDVDKKTDYESIEIIARRNKLHLNKYFRASSG